jgi:UDP-glucose-4-epimerase GalE
MTDRIPILVVGGAGYIGSHCAKALSDAGYLPVCFDNLSSGHSEFVKWGPLVEGELFDTGLITRTIQSYQTAVVLHLAGYSAIGGSVTDPLACYTANVNGTLSLLAAMREAHCSRLIFSSSGSVYGNAGPGLISEQHHCAPENPYGASKWMIERILSDCRNAYQLRPICFRYFNAAGADPDNQIGELRDDETHLIPRAIMALQGRLSDFSVYGDDYDTEDGTAVRDYIHVTDLADAHVSAVSRLIAGDSAGTYNLGTGKGSSVSEILKAVAYEAGKPVPYQVKHRRVGDPPSLIADPSLARSEMGFAAKHSDLSFIIKTAWAWHNKRGPTQP